MSNIKLYDTMTFSEVFDSAEVFLTAVKDCPLMLKTASPLTYIMGDASIMNLYYLLFAKYGNSPIANADVTQFKYKVYSLIFQYGPTWEKRLQLQTEIRELSVQTVMNGSTAIYNKAYNPGTTPTTQTTTELDYINEQNVQKIKKNEAAAYAELWGLLRDDITAAFIDRFKICFKKVVLPERPLLYTEDEEE